MELKAIQKSTRQTPRKVRLVANSVRKMSIPDAIAQLAISDRRASILVLKVLRQALANAEHNHRLTVDGLKIKSILVNEGARYKRFNAVSRGRGHAILKRTCHVTVILEEKIDLTDKPAEKKSPAKKTATKPKTKTKAEGTRLRSNELQRSKEKPSKVSKAKVKKSSPKK